MVILRIGELWKVYCMIILGYVGYGCVLPRLCMALAKMGLFISNKEDSCVMFIGRTGRLGNRKAVEGLLCDLYLVMLGTAVYYQGGAWY